MAVVDSLVGSLRRSPFFLHTTLCVCESECVCVRESV
jgi:hypothetical protein